MNSKADVEHSKPTGCFERLFFTDEEYHSVHPMLHHRHKTFAELIYVLDGKASYRVDKRMYELKPGNLAVIEKNTWHGEEPFNSQPCTTLTIGISDINIKGREIKLLDKNQRPVLEFETGSAIEKLIMALYDLQKVPEPDMHLCNSLVNSILSMVYTKLQYDQTHEDRQDMKNDELIRMITEYLDDNYIEPISLEELGEKFGISHYYLAHLFKNETGVSPMKYVMHRKIGEVQNLLMNSDVSISDIGERLGFSSSCHLSSVFKKYFGISPKVYRQHFKNIQASESDRSLEEAYI